MHAITMSAALTQRYSAAPNSDNKYGEYYLIYKGSYHTDEFPDNPKILFTDRSLNMFISKEVRSDEDGACNGLVLYDNYVQCT